MKTIIKRTTLLSLLALGMFNISACGPSPSVGASTDNTSKASSQTSNDASSTTQSSKGSDTSSVPGSSDNPSSNTSSEEVNDTFVIEAEYTDLGEKEGHGYSGGAVGREMVCQDADGKAEASNGYFISYLYGEGLSLNFVFNSTKAVDNVELILRLSCEIKDITITPDIWAVKVNDNDENSHGLDYGSYDLLGASASDSDNYINPFRDKTIKVPISLKEGKNQIDLVTTNSISMGGTMYATAPMVDCIKLSKLSGAELSYTKIESNLGLFEE